MQWQSESTQPIVGDGRTQQKEEQRTTEMKAPRHEDAARNGKGDGGSTTRYRRNAPPLS
jgi:hypothetical protein